MITRRMACTLVASLATTSLLAACGKNDNNTVETTTGTAEKIAVTVGALKGPTAIGLASFIDKAKQQTLNNDYQLSFAGSPDDMLAQVVSNSVDIALLPANMAAALYNKTDHGVKVININTLGVLQLLSKEKLTSFEDLAGKNIITTGRGASPEYVLNYLLEKKAIANNVSVTYASEASEVVARLLQEESNTCILPEPFATAALTKIDGLERITSLGDVWNDTVEDGSKLVQGVTVVRAEFLSKHPDVVQDFLTEHAKSSQEVLDNPKRAAEILVQEDLFDSEKLIAKAIPNCALVSISGASMKEALTGYLAVLANANKKSVGGKLPDDAFYYSA